MSTIHVVNVDGFHNSGKTTQIRLLKANLEDAGYFSVIRKGCGSRKGLGAQEHDPESSWWRHNRPRILAAGIEGNQAHTAAVESIDRLNRELFLAKNWWMPRQLKKNGFAEGVILLDRHVVSTLFMYRRLNPECGFSEISQFNTRGSSRDIVIPDLIYLFEALPEVLLERNRGREGGVEKKKFNEGVLSRHFDSFETLLYNLPEEIMERAIAIDTNRGIDEVQAELLERTLLHLEQSSSQVEANTRPGLERF